jgi:membrane protease YdiL (CAAX protease family)
LGLLLLAPLAGSAPGGRPLGAFWQWGAIAALVATLEEVAIRGRLQRRWTQDFGPPVAILAGAAVFALIHLPRYGASAMPLDFSVGLALGGLRALSGRVMPGAIAHVIADWGAWFIA